MRISLFLISYATRLVLSVSKSTESFHLDDENNSGRYRCSSDEEKTYPELCQLLSRALTEPHILAQEFKSWAEERSLLVNIDATDIDQLESTKSIIETKRSLRNNGSPSLPVVMAHGMGDSCFNNGMESIGEKVSDMLDGAYTTCIPTGENFVEDTLNGFILNMDANVDIFAEKVRADPALKNGFNAIGFSQGNNVIRGYIARYNNPPVNAFLSVCGVNAGVAAIPYCEPSFPKGLGDKCEALVSITSKAAYTKFVQEHLFQANYWRDPEKVKSLEYKTHSQLAKWGNEGLRFNKSLKDNFARTNKFVWIMAEEDMVVWPRQGEQWGAPDPANPLKSVIPMEETEWYTNDTFGLKSADDAGKMFFESFRGNHLKFSLNDLSKWVDTYLK